MLKIKEFSYCVDDHNTLTIFIKDFNDKEYLLCEICDSKENEHIEDFCLEVLEEMGYEVSNG